MLSTGLLFGRVLSCVKRGERLALEVATSCPQAAARGTHCETSLPSFFLAHPVTASPDISTPSVRDFSSGLLLANSPWDLEPFTEDERGVLRNMSSFL